MGKAERKSELSEPGIIAPFLEPLRALQRLLERYDQRGVIIGGIAASLLGQPRLTADLDAVILLSTEDLPRLIQAAAEEGMNPRITDAEAFARKNRVLLLTHSASGIHIDVSLGILPFEVEMVARGQKLSFGDLSLRLPTPEDLIIESDRSSVEGFCRYSSNCRQPS
jgi:hypothetical protein